MDKNKIIERFKRILKDLRTEKGLSQDEFAKELGISKGAVSYYETGQRVPDIVVLSAIADYFKVSTDYFLGRTETPSIKEDMQIAIKTTGLTEKTIETMQRNMCSAISVFSESKEELNESEIENYNEILSVVNEIFVNENFWDMVGWLYDLKITSEESIQDIRVTSNNDCMNAGKLLDVEPYVIFMHLGTVINSKDSKVNYEERGDMMKYNAFCASQKLIENFDLRDMRKTFTKEQWLDYLKIDEKTLQDLKKKSEEFKQGQQKKAGD